jgi:hypothetical protein
MGHPAVRGELPDAAGADEIVGVLRLRMRIQKANPHASLRMTVRGASSKIPTSREGREKWGTRQSGENCLTPLGADESIGVLRLRMRIHRANPHASLRMTRRRRVEILQTKTSD